MFDSINSWDLEFKNEIDILNEINLFKINIKYLLDVEKENFNIIEELVYELSKFHLEKINLNEKDVFIEFCIENLKKNKIDINYCNNNEELIAPLVSTITYINKNNIPDILINIDLESYKFKNINNATTLGFSFPKFLKHISFEGSKFFNGISDIFNENVERLTLKVNIWKTKPANVDIYMNRTTPQNS
jgi:hypothetical protein